ncbi:5-formyltetrahydrofolate cyclo-ligase [Anaeromicropila populeti]|uniref:5-formyltetrahydrofolate cyclo-ligase n=1 Tax=Anaeromicropila populeti TaxID=37658 RepID=A0A1I6KYL4_9FIRM|nr:5-formyltetrahydrofolate cyclo-ligase [Anaeromicropila populeti]SFR96305.1 5-formyltetrahydrofolate cyclo-ligase [Anaeromicropila populeti]
MTKEEARRLVRKEKKQVSQEEIQQGSKRIIEKLMSHKGFSELEAVYCYVSYNQEVETKDFLYTCLKLGKRVYVPKIINGNMEFCHLRAMEDLKTGYQGIFEPADTIISKETEVFMVLPGLAFDTSYNRVGYGGGFYDRFLQTHVFKELVKVAVAFDFQIFEKVEADAYDEKVDQIITPTKMI